MTDLIEDLTAALGGRYQLERELGRGGMATVFLARDLKHHRSIALKVLRPELAAWLGRDRFLREVRLTAGFDHPHILPVLDSGGADDNGFLWYTMPFVQGESLRDRLRRESRLPLPEVVRLTSQIADALAYAHARGVVHRDIKPENILLSEGHARVADFGIARSAEPPERDERLTATGLVIGTPTYMSPEQAGGGAVDPRSDVYSLACVTYEMLAGEPPHTGPSAQAIITRRYREPYPSLNRSRPGLPAGVDAVLRRALAIEPADRFPSAREYVSSLEEAALGKAPFIARDTLQSRKTRAGLLLLLALVVVAMSVWAVGLAHRVSRESNRAAGPVRIAVLPFTNIGDSSRAYLTDGLVDAVRGRLAALPSLEVIASSSTEEYRRSSKPLRVIGRELGVLYVLVGKVRWISAGTSGERMQVAPELVETASGATRWQDAVQAGMAEAPALPATIALGIVQALGVRVTPSARNALSDSATTSPEAYDLYLRATDYVHRVGLYQAPISLLKPAIELFRRAIAIDTGFARAKVGLANTLRVSADYAGGDSVGYHQADSLISAVLERDPTMVDAIVAQGLLREDQDDADAALRLYREAAALQPSNAIVQGGITFVQALKQDSAALVTGARAVALAPRDPDMLRRVIQGTMIFRNYDQLERYSDRLIALEAGEPNGYFHKAVAQLGARGDTTAALGTLRRSEAVMGGISELIAWGYAMCGPSGWRRWHALRVGELMSPQGRDTLDYYWNQGQIAAAEKRAPAERAYADTLLRLLLRVKRTDPFYPLALVQVGWARAVLGDTSRARKDLAAAEAAIGEKPGFDAFFQYQVASAYAALGDITAAIQASRKLLEHPSAYNRRMVRLAPEFARLWGIPEFQRLLADNTLP